MEQLTIQQRIEKVRNTVAELLKVASAKELIYRPAEFDNLTKLQFAELVEAFPEATLYKGSYSYSANFYMDGVYVCSDTKHGEVHESRPDVRAELKSLLSAA